VATQILGQPQGIAPTSLPYFNGIINMYLKEWKIIKNSSQNFCYKK